jgi:hypothetical protein
VNDTNYNTDKNYNFTLLSGGATFNSCIIATIVNVSDFIRFNENVTGIIAKNIIYDNITFTDFFNQYVYHEFEPDYFASEDRISNSALFNLAEKLNVPDILGNIICALYLSDNQSFIDEIRQLNTIISESEDFDANDIESVNAAIQIAEKQGLDDAKELIAYLASYDVLGATDKEPRTAVSDFLIGKDDDKDSAYDWIIPFGMKIDWSKSSIQVMPQAENTYAEMPYVDGSLIENTVYKNRIFSIVAYSELGLSVSEKEQLKSEICRILDATKNNPKKMTFQDSSTSFDVTYSGTAEITDGASFVRVTLPFESQPYGYPLFSKEVAGTGLLVNDGDADVGCVNTISSGAVNPSFKIGSIEYSWSGTVPANTKLIIDHNDYSCYLETIKGVRTNAISKLTGEFQRIPKGTSVAITAYGDTENYLVTTFQEKILWGGNL